MIAAIEHNEKKKPLIWNLPLRLPLKTLNVSEVLIHKPGRESQRRLINIHSWGEIRVFDVELIMVGYFFPWENGRKQVS